MNENTHGIGPVEIDGFRLFIDGIPDECDHKGAHDLVCETASGKMIYWHTFRQWASYTEPLRHRLIHEYQKQQEDPIVMETSQCRKCKKIFYPNLY